MKITAMNLQLTKLKTFLLFAQYKSVAQQQQPWQQGPVLLPGDVYNYNYGMFSYAYAPVYVPMARAGRSESRKMKRGRKRSTSLCESCRCATPNPYCELAYQPAAVPVSFPVGSVL